MELDIRSLSRDTKVALACDPHTSPATLAILAKDDDDVVLAAVAENPHTPPVMLGELAKISSEYVCLYIAQNPSATPATLAMLARERSRADGVLLHIASNLLTPADTLDMLAKRSDEELSVVALTNPNTSETTLREAAHDKRSTSRKAVATNPNTQEDVLEDLSNDNNWAVRAAVATNPSTSHDVLRNLAMFGDPEVRRELARSSTLPPDVLEMLGRDADTLVRMRARANPLYQSRALKLDISVDDKIKLAKDPTTTPDELAHPFAEAEEQFQEYGPFQTDDGLKDEWRAGTTLSPLVIKQEFFEKYAVEINEDTWSQIELGPDGPRRVLVSDICDIAAWEILRKDDRGHTTGVREAVGRCDEGSGDYVETMIALAESEGLYINNIDALADIYGIENVPESVISPVVKPEQHRQPQPGLDARCAEANEAVADLNTQSEPALTQKGR
jgi:hypothetical protein